MSFDLCIYHDPCTDGTAAAWIVRNVCPNVELVGCVAGMDPEEPYDTIDAYTGKSVICVDICPTAERLKTLLGVVKHLTIIDHHATTSEVISKISDHPRLTLIFSEEKCGCELVWEHFMNGLEEIPWFLKYISDRDLYKNPPTQPHSNEIGLALHDGKHTRTFEGLDELYRMNDRDTESFRRMLLSKGRRLVEWKESVIRGSLSSRLECTYRSSTYERECRVWLYTCPRHVVSDLGNRLLGWQFDDGELPDFVVCWQYDVEDHLFWIAFRSALSSEVEVHHIAQELDVDGGGHRRAAGCCLPGHSIIRTIFVPK